MTSEEDLFLLEKFYEPLSLAPELSRVSTDSYLSTIKYEDYDGFYENISRLRLSGDYCVDYENGKIYVATNNFNINNFGLVSYGHNSAITSNKNIIAVTEASRKKSGANSVYNSVFNYNKIENDFETISVLCKKAE